MKKKNKILQEVGLWGGLILVLLGLFTNEKWFEYTGMVILLLTALYRRFSK